MYNNKSIENLELKLAQTRKENAEKLGNIETEYKNEYSEFFTSVFENDLLGSKRFISAFFQLEKLDNPDKNNKEILKNSLIKSIDLINLPGENKRNLLEKTLNIVENKDIISENLLEKADISKDVNFPILEDLVNSGNLDKTDLVDISMKYKTSKNFLDSINVLSENKKEIVKSNYYKLNNTKESDRVSDFEDEFNSEIKNSKLLQKYPKALKFIGKNYFKLRLRNRVETKKDRLKRMFKLAFLKLYKLKYSGIDINCILNKIDNIDDFENLVSLLIKFFEQLKQNPGLQKDFIVSSELDEVKNLVSDAENNKEKIMFSEGKLVKISGLIESGEKHIGEDDLNKLMSSDVNMIGNEVLDRSALNAGILNKDNKSEEEDNEEENNKEIDLEEYLEELREKLFELDKKKRKVFLEGKYDDLDLINSDLLDLDIEIQKVLKLLGIEE